MVNTRLKLTENMFKNKVLKIKDKDNVAIALLELKKGEVITTSNKKIRLKDTIQKGHKLSTREIFKDKNIIKYGFPIGKSIKEIKTGEHVHTHNLASNLSTGKEYKYLSDIQYIEDKNLGLTFKGYDRGNGRYGIRNELWIIPTVGCVSSTADKIVKVFKNTYDIAGIDGVTVLDHQFGCSQYGEDLSTTMKILRNIAVHPNAGGVLFLGLGCEFSKVSDMKDLLKGFGSNRIRFLIAQEVEDEIKEGARILKELFNEAKTDKRKEIPISELNIGLKCGGSDGFSGLTANPLLGVFSDFLIGQIGTTVLTEVPEMFGAEKILMDRAVSKKVFLKTVKIIDDFKKYLLKYGQQIYVNPSPGNQDGGITTLEEKSLGCVQKGGKAPVADVVDYTGIVSKKGLNLLNSPSNDLVATTALGAVGCQMVLFTTGRGTPYGSFIPTVKISTNSELSQLKRNWIDFDAGRLLEGIPMEELLGNLVKLIIEVASGEKVLNEKNDFKEIAIWKIGATG